MAKILQEHYATKDEVKRLNDFMAVMVVVLFIGFAAMFGTIATLVISHFDSAEATSAGVKDRLEMQSVKIDALTKTVQNEQKSMP